MYLLTWHGTLVLLTPGLTVPAHLELPIRKTAPPPLDITIEGDGAIHPGLGALRIQPARHPGTITLFQGNGYLCAERDRRSMLFDRQVANDWEGFLPVSAQDCHDLQRLLANGWILRQTRAAIPRGGVKLETGFRLWVGGLALDLASCLPLSQRRADPEAAPDRFVLRDANADSLEIVLAEPRGSALIQSAKWPVRARRSAEILALAVHRAIGGHEPEQAIFERDAAFLQRNGGEAALPELIARSGLLGKAKPTAESTTPAATWSQAPQCQVISLGTSCLPACTLRKMGAERTPMPFDWLRSNPAMVRHCLETDFEILLDKSHHISLTGKNMPGEPYDGCDHAFYRDTLGLQRVFNHNDPTRTADYRYMRACVERFRDAMAQDEPKILFQLREHYLKPEEEFAATAAAVDAAGKRCVFLQFTVSPPDPSLALPIVSVIARIGPHVLYRLQPVSQMDGEFFESEADFALLAQVVSTHAAHPATSRGAAAAARQAWRTATHRFTQVDRPDPLPSALDQPAIGRLNRNLNRFLTAAGLPRRFSFAMFKSAVVGPQFRPASCIADISNNAAVLRFMAGSESFWVPLIRSLAAIAVIDAMFKAGPVDDMRFHLELGDAGHAENGASFCSRQPTNCLLPDSDFINSLGYESTRHLMSQNRIAWHDRAPIVFWRGSTTGLRRGPPPPPGVPDDFTWLPRLDLCRRARDSALATHYDVGIANLAQITRPQLVARIEAAGLCKPPVRREAFLGHKGIIVIDGNANAWSALFNALLMGACVFKVDSPRDFRQWYYASLQPWVHYVPVLEDLSDLDDRVAWMLEHDAQARAIGEAGQALANAMTFETEIEAAARRLRNWLPLGKLR